MTTTCQVLERDIAALRPYARNAWNHSKKQIQQIVRSIERFGFTNPVLVSDDGEIIAGHGRVEAAGVEVGPDAGALASVGSGTTRLRAR